MGWLTPPIFKDGDADATVAANILGGGRSSRLFKSLVYEQQIAQSVTVQQNSLTLGSMFTIEVIARPGKTPEQIEAAINTELEKFRTAGPEAAEVDRARNTIETGIVNGLQRLGGFGGVADRLNTYEHYLGDPGYLAKDLARYRATTPATVKAFAEKYLTTNARVVVFGVPGEKKLAPEVPKPAPPTGGSESGRKRQRRRAMAQHQACRRSGLDAEAAIAHQLHAAERIDGAVRATDRRPGRICQSRRPYRQRRQSAGHAWPRQLHRGDAGRRHQDAKRAADCR